MSTETCNLSYTLQDGIIEVESPAMDIIDKLMWRFDELLLSRLISHWRKRVWSETMTLLNQNDQHGRLYQITALESKVLRTANRIILR